METISIYIYLTASKDSRQRSYGYVTYVKVTLASLGYCIKINRSEQNRCSSRAINMIVGINVYMIGVQIYYTVYDRSTRVLYAVAIAVAE